jgi:hypothetical protein
MNLAIRIEPILTNLPFQAQRELLDFAEFLRTKHACTVGRQVLPNDGQGLNKDHYHNLTQATHQRENQELLDLEREYPWIPVSPPTPVYSLRRTVTVKTDRPVLGLSKEQWSSLILEGDDQ